jgi:hypothetical protein
MERETEMSQSDSHPSLSSLSSGESISEIIMPYDN